MTQGDTSSLGRKLGRYRVVEGWRVKVWYPTYKQGWFWTLERPTGGGWITVARLGDWASESACVRDAKALADALGVRLVQEDGR